MMQHKKQKKRIAKKQTKKDILLLAILFVMGLGIFAYPFVSRWISERQASKWVAEYESRVSTLSQEVKGELWTEAEDYNHALVGMPVKDPFIQGSGTALPQNYLDILNLLDVMAYIEIPKIGVTLPIYHGVSEEVLAKGVGHMEGTSFPIGGSGTHCLLTGHTGLPEAKLFTGLTEMEPGDQFYIVVLETELVYQVDQIQVIEPDELGSLYTEAGEDYVTLITCTPYGVNSHRLLVRGTQVDQIIRSISLSTDDTWQYVVVFALSTLMCIMILGVFCRDYKKKKRFLSDAVRGESS